MKKSLTLFLTFLLLASSVFFVMPGKVEARTLLNTGPAPVGTCPSGTPRSSAQGRDGNSIQWYCYAEGEAVPDGSVSAQQRQDSALNNCGTFDLLCYGSKTIAGILLTLSSAALALVALIFNEVLSFSIVNMAANLTDPNGLGAAINNAWATLRDLANLVFIFVLLWAAIQTILELNTGKFGTTIRNIIIIALLINFSLFFTKVVIDASNIATIGFYNSIFATAKTGGETNLTDTANTITLKAGDFSGIFMRALGIQSFYGAKSLDVAAGNNAGTVLVLGVMGAVTMSVLTVVLLVAMVLFVARFIMLVFILILSPIAFIGYAIPGMQGNFGKWKDALINQSFFAPLFMLMMWIAIKIMFSPGFLRTIGAGAEFSEVATRPQNTVGLFLNFVLVIGFIVGALVLSKQMASKTPYFDKITGGLGAASAGTTAWLGRKSFGVFGKMAAGSNRLQGEATSTATGFGASLRRGAARAALYTADTAQNATFDVRNSRIPTSVIGDMIRGTAGRTEAGRALGLNDVNIPDIEVATRIIGDALGKVGTKGQKELSAESAKRVREQDAAEGAMRASAEAKDAIDKGQSALVGSPEYKKMEKALAKMSDKEIETLATGNRALLKNQNFANMISVKQLEALNKSEQFSDFEKTNFKDNRFKDINDAVKALAGGTPIPASVTKQMKALADSELELIDPTYLENPDFVKELRAGQIEFVTTKSSKFTRTQKDKVKEIRIQPLKDALSTGTSAVAQTELQSMSPKEIAGLDATILKDSKLVWDGTHTAYSPGMLKKMALEMNPNKIKELRTELLGHLPPLGNETREWLEDKNTGVVDFS